MLVFAPHRIIVLYMWQNVFYILPIKNIENLSESLENDSRMNSFDTRPMTYVVTYANTR